VEEPGHARKRTDLRHDQRKDRRNGQEGPITVIDIYSCHYRWLEHRAQ